MYTELQQHFIEVQETIHLETVAEEANTDGHGVSLCVVSHPQRLVLATGSCIYVSEVCSVHVLACA